MEITEVLDGDTWKFNAACVLEQLMNLVLERGGQLVVKADQPKKRYTISDGNRTADVHQIYEICFVYNRHFYHVRFPVNPFFDSNYQKLLVKGPRNTRNFVIPVSFNFVIPYNVCGCWMQFDPYEGTISKEIFNSAAEILFKTLKQLDVSSNITGKESCWVHYCVTEKW